MRQYLFSFMIMLLCGCATADIVADTVVFTGRTAVGAVKTTGNLIGALGSGKSKSARNKSTGYGGATNVSLIRHGNSYAVKVKVNRRMTAVLLLDTGADYTLISRELAGKLGIKRGKSRKFNIAGGKTVSGKEIVLSEISVGGARAKNIKAVVLDGDRTKGYDGLLGMTFLKNFIFSVDTSASKLSLERRYN